METSSSMLLETFSEIDEGANQERSEGEIGEEQPQVT